MSEMHRVRSLELDVCEFHPQIVWFLNQMRHDFAPLLEFFRCNFHGDSNPDLEYWLKSAGTCHLFRGGAPLLHSLSISGTQSSPRLLPPRGGVTSCTIADLQWADAHDKIVPLLTSMPLLTTLTLNNVRTIPDEPFGFPVLLLPSLKSLSMTGYAAFWFCGVLVSPLLESLTIIHSSNYTMDDLLRNIRNTRKFPLLRSLAIQLDVDALVSDGPTEARVFPSLDAEFMKSTSLLTHLRLDSTEESIRLVIRSMMNPHQAEQGPESVLWPHLQSVDFMNCLKSEALDFLSYRNKMGHSLADFSFRGVTIRPAGGDIAEMRRLLQAWDESYEYYE
ncbi:hypothetical protein JAAARDRAFT_38794 [Jaapia argillacea MUCL 33604]|uniref:F-box domain-containing protein n=1 Tax=Jaapia argillacea MUCL 33604 TaxID=933084 RepID=A0A067PJ07_9AGAM|nr:hypothetical protein JAAARDRAFT_38794 [Jaapia argillacea MUCL 33604]